MIALSSQYANQKRIFPLCQESVRRLDMTIPSIFDNVRYTYVQRSSPILFTGGYIVCLAIFNISKYMPLSKSDGH